MNKTLAHQGREAIHKTVGVWERERGGRALSHTQGHVTLNDTFASQSRRRKEGRKKMFSPPPLRHDDRECGEPIFEKNIWIFFIFYYLKRIEFHYCEMKCVELFTCRRWDRPWRFGIRNWKRIAHQREPTGHAIDFQLFSLWWKWQLGRCRWIEVLRLHNWLYCRNTCRTSRSFLRCVTQKWQK